MKKIYKTLLVISLLLSFCLFTCGAAFDNTEYGYKEILNNSLFVGDSFTERLDDYKAEMNSEVTALAGGTSDEIRKLDFPDERPDRIIVLTGINDLREEQIKVNIDKEINLIKRLRAKYGFKCSIYIQAVFPVKEEIEGINKFITNEYIEIYNTMLRYYCMNIDKVFYIDTRMMFVDKNGFLINDEDGIHINRELNPEWLKSIAMEVQKCEK